MSPNLMQNLIDGLSAEWQRERSATQLTLGGLITALESMLPSELVPGLHSPHSYRGYYDDLAFKLSGERRTVSALLAECRQCMGRVFTGYKGGGFMMGATTPLWVSEYGEASGMRLMAINQDGTVTTAKEE